MMALPRKRNSCNIHTTVILLLLLVGFTATNHTEEVREGSISKVTQVDEDASDSASDEAGRERRQVRQSYREYDRVQVSPDSGASLPAPPTTHLSITPHLEQLINSLLLNQEVITASSASRRPTVTEAYLPYTPPRTPVPTLPLITSWGGVGPEVTPVPQYLRPLQQSTHIFGVTPDVSGTSVCPGGLKCVPLVRCAPSYHEVENQLQLACSIFGGAVGVCCPGQHNANNPRQMLKEAHHFIKLPQLNFNYDLVNKALKIGLLSLKERDDLETRLQDEGIQVVDTGDPAYHHLQFFKTSLPAIKLHRAATVHVRAAHYLRAKFGLSPLLAGYGLQQIDVTNTKFANTCQRSPVCQERDIYYRRVDGACNNLVSPRMGQARTAFQRLCPPHYSDGLSMPRVSRTGSNLPSARLVSTSIAGDMDRPSSDLTHSVMQLGQFINHDINNTPINRLNNSGIQCCSDNNRGFAEAAFLHPACFPIEVPANDSFYSRNDRRCMNFVRSMFAPRNSPCGLGYAEQMNQVTHFLDGSNIYGSSATEEQQLRMFRRGLLRVQENDLLPADLQVMECETTRERLPCFMAGDNRVNQQVILSVMHTVWVRIHNRIARELARLNPHWSDETLYQETRRIVVALYQHIIYNEWLPNVLGKDYMAASGLLPRLEGYSKDYDSDHSAAILNEFSTAAFRFGHSLVQGKIELVDVKSWPIDRLPLHENFNNPRQLYTPGRLDELLRGLATQPAQMSDRYVTSELTNRLFGSRQMPAGMDLVALNTQRGRDHGIAPYNELRERCGLPRARKFEDLLDVFPSRTMKALSRLYSSVDDIDPFVAGISERQAPGSILGPTFRCIVGDQFTRLKRGDRFFYDLGDLPSSFTEAQLHSIRMISWARIICEAGNMVGYVQPLAFRQPRGLNERVPCESPSIPALDLTPWMTRV
ncbi:peroxidase-like [Cherax quadricarinatus]|uniref:peroxidase-like n=1 Tax=Cherax quadricarinatus TaxID=27406 RepID=UPI00387E3630